MLSSTKNDMKIVPIRGPDRPILKCYYTWCLSAMKTNFGTFLPIGLMSNF